MILYFWYWVFRLSFHPKQWGGFSILILLYLILLISTPYYLWANRKLKIDLTFKTHISIK